MKLSFVKSRSTLVLSAACLFGASSFAQEAGVEALLAALSQQQVDALEGYLEANPEAADRGVAVEGLIWVFKRAGRNAEMVALLEKRYGESGKGEGSDIEFVLMENAVPIVEQKTLMGDKQGAREFIERVRLDYEGHSAFGPISGLLAQLSASLLRPQVGESMDIAFTDRSGDEINLEEMKGKVVLVDFWATWCGPCLQEMPNIGAVYNAYHSQGFEVIGISQDQDPAVFERYLAQSRIPWPQLLDAPEGFGGKYGITSLPATFLIGKNGKIAATNLRGPELAAKVRELLAGE